MAFEVPPAGLHGLPEVGEAISSSKSVLGKLTKLFGAQKDSEQA